MVAIQRPIDGRAMAVEPCADQPKTDWVYLRRDRGETRPDFEYVARKTHHRVFQQKHCASFEPAGGQNRQTQRWPELAKGQARKFRGR